MIDWASVDGFIAIPPDFNPSPISCRIRGEPVYVNNNIIDDPGITITNNGNVYYQSSISSAPLQIIIDNKYISNSYATVIPLIDLKIYVD